ncbi:MAG: rod-binding protein [Rhodobacteraceae bacterium]|nr:rod-binding protein [Paracoccaceae bacterium]
MTPDLLPARPALPLPAAPVSGPLRERAEALEAAFLAEMLRHAGLGSGPGEGFNTLRGEFGGGIGEEQFGSFLREAMAGQIVQAGGIGLTESLVRALGRQEG